MLILAVWWQIGPAYWWHPLGQCAGTRAEIDRCHSYNWHSGLEGNLLALVALVPLLFAVWRVVRHLECHEASCHRHGAVRLPDGTRTCHRHDPRYPHEAPQPGHVRACWEAHLEREKGEA